MLALTMGDPAGIGPEITAAAWSALRGGGPRFIVLGDPALYAAHLPVQVFDDITAADNCDFAAGLPVLARPLAAPARPGQPDTRNAPGIAASIADALALCRAGAVRGMVTNPITKTSLAAAGIRHNGHTGYIAELLGLAGAEVMMLASPMLRVVPVTVHVSLARAVATLSTAAIITQARITHAALTADFGIQAPRLAVAGLNPHAGEDGMMGDEETRIIAPAITALNDAGIDARGPLPPDTLFTPAARASYDAAICMYHDQALIPLKTLDMAGGVNVTLGLPVVRTSPDHGTAFDIAGQGRADPASLIAALRLADAIATNRSRNQSNFRGVP